MGEVEGSSDFWYAHGHVTKEGFSVCVVYRFNGYCERAGYENYYDMWSEGIGGDFFHAAAVPYYRYRGRSVWQEGGHGVCQLWHTDAGVSFSDDEPVYCLKAK